jgi:hypothetical protein
MSMHKLPALVLQPKGARDPEVEAGKVLPAADPRIPPLYFESRCQVSGDIPRQGLDVSNLATPNLDDAKSRASEPCCRSQMGV